MQTQFIIFSVIALAATVYANALADYNDELVCGYNGDMYTYFPDQEYMENMNRMGPSLPQFKVVHVDFCKTLPVENLATQLNLDFNSNKCLKACPLLLRPVCISNGVYRGLIDNDCLLDTYNCLKAENVPSFYKLSAYKC